MEKRSQIVVKENKQGLRISPRGDFDSITALRLIDLLSRQFQKQGQVFIDTVHLGRVCPSAAASSQGCLRDARLPLDRLILRETRPGHRARREQGSSCPS
jgi:hypothetical protein